jgi:hypothetical protein
MAGSMRQRGKDSWQLRVHLGRDPITGRKRSVERTFRGTKREADKALSALVKDAERMSPHSNARATVETVMREWLAHATPSLSPRTVEVSRMYINRAIVPAIGSKQAAKLTTLDLDRFYGRLLAVGAGGKPYSPATIRRVHGIVRRALTQGVRWGWLTHNAAVDACLPRVPLRELRPPTPGRARASLPHGAEGGLVLRDLHHVGGILGRSTRRADRAALEGHRLRIGAGNNREGHRDRRSEARRTGHDDPPESADNP